MNRIILIGNGFDLAHGLKTSYKHFIDWFWEEEATKIITSNNRDYFEDDFFIVRNINGYYTTTITNYQRLQQAISYGGIRLEYKNQFFKIIEDTLKFQKWVDIEEEYYTQLKKAMNATFYNNEKKPIEKLNEDFEKIKLELEKYLSSIDAQLKRNNDVKDIIYDEFQSCNFTKNKNILLKDMMETSYNFYSQQENQNINANRTCRLIDEYIKEGKSFEECLNDIKNSDWYFFLYPKEILFLNFNYTDTERIYKNDRHITLEEKEIKQETIHIHGELNNPKNHIIFGYGDELDDDYKTILKKNDNNLLENVKSVKYAETYNYKRLLNFIESDNYQIFIMGHSCGNSDRTLLNTLFEHKNCQSIKIFFREEFNEQGEKISDNFSDIYRNIMRNFTDFSELRARVVDKTNSIPLPQNN